MRPGILNLDLYRGDTFAWRLLLWEDQDKTQPFDLTGATARAEIRYESGGLEIMDIDAAVTLPNQIDLTLDADAWLEFPYRKKPAPIWDLQITFADIQVFTALRGDVFITNDVTDSTLPTSASLAFVPVASGLTYGGVP